MGGDDGATAPHRLGIGSSIGSGGNVLHCSRTTGRVGWFVGKGSESSLCQLARVGQWVLPDGMGERQPPCDEMPSTRCSQPIPTLAPAPAQPSSPHLLTAARNTITSASQPSNSNRAPTSTSISTQTRPFLTTPTPTQFDHTTDPDHVSSSRSRPLGPPPSISHRPRIIL